MQLDYIPIAAKRKKWEITKNSTHLADATVDPDSV